MRKIKLKNKTFKINWDAQAYFRFGRAGGVSTDFSTDTTRAPEAFANSVILIWSMLEDEQRAEYSTPESMAGLFLPSPDESTLNAVAAEIYAGNETLGIKK